jgi:hypothetical protein
MERINDLYAMLDELEEDLADLLGDISEVIGMIEDGQIDEALRYLNELGASLQGFLDGEDDGEFRGYDIEFNDDEDEKRR